VETSFDPVRFQSLELHFLILVVCCVPLFHFNIYRCLLLIPTTSSP